jgi:ribosomal protein S18 acetylase RimI-like enzyme
MPQRWPISLDTADRLRRVLSELRGLTATDLHDIADLERRVTDHDGGRLKLEYGSLRSRPGDQVDALTWRTDGRVTGFVGLYGFGHGQLELAGMVDPAVRRTGIGTALLNAAKPVGRDRGHDHALLVTPRSTDTGAAFAHASGGELEHSEHFMVLGATPDAGPADPRVTVRAATEADTETLGRILAAAFGDEPTGFKVQDNDDERTLAIALDDMVVGTVRLTREGPVGSVYGFGVDPAHQGRGIGRDVLRRVCRQLRDEGAQRVTLEVASDNDSALGLYLSVGFSSEATEDYFAVSLEGSAHAVRQVT